MANDNNQANKVAGLQADSMLGRPNSFVLWGLRFSADSQLHVIIVC